MPAMRRWPISKNSIYSIEWLGGSIATLAIANSETSGEYPAGSVISLVPNEVMIKHDAGWNEATNEWEFSS
jgi:hypothetical protein